MKIIFLIIFLTIFIIGTIITFKTKDKRFPNHPYLGWIICIILMAVALYSMYNTMYDDFMRGVEDAAYNIGYRDSFK